MTVRAPELPHFRIPTSLPLGHVPLAFDRNKTLHATPAWMLRSVVVGPRRASAPYQRLNSRAFGSSCDFGDEFRFDPTHHRLMSCILNVPEKGIRWSSAQKWLSIRRQIGLPRAMTKPAGFLIESLDVRAFDALRGTLLASRRRGLGPLKNPSRWKIANDLDLLFENGIYQGWMLHYACNYLQPDDPTRPWRKTGKASPRLIRWTEQLLRFMDERALKRLDRQDARMKRQLDVFRTRIHSESPVTWGEHVLAEALRDLGDRF